MVRCRHKALGVSADTWKMMLDFSKNTKPDLSDMADYYPPFVDEFVDFLVRYTVVLQLFDKKQSPHLCCGMAGGEAWIQKPEC